MNYHKFKADALRNKCRRCVNSTYGLNLSYKDCLYWLYPEKCCVCGEVCNILIGIAPLSRWKIWLKKIDKKPGKELAEQ